MEPLGPRRLWGGEVQLCRREDREGQDPRAPISARFVGLLSSKGLAPGSVAQNSPPRYKANKRRRSGWQELCCGGVCPRRALFLEGCEISFVWGGSE